MKMTARLFTVLAFTLAAGLLIGSTGFASFVQHTSSLDFCTSCHEMNDSVYEEYKKTIHYSNTAGVRAVCADCHVPHDWRDVVVRKLAAAKDVYHHLLGTIDTAEKFDARRLQMAQQVWDRMKENGSKECRNCHAFDAMVFANQKQRARKQHELAMADGRSCVECHKGIAHKAVHEQLQKAESQDDFNLKF